MAKDVEKERVLVELRENSPFIASLAPLLEEVKKTGVTSEIRFELSTLRNRNLITREEQEKLRKTTVGFFGLSVGSHAAVTWAMGSRADNIKISDPDTIDPTNLNRLRAGWGSVGKLKTAVVMKEIRGINPDVHVTANTKTDEESVLKLFDHEPKLNFVVDETDSMETKLFLRKLARARKIPLVSAADVGDDVVLDVERYDISPQPEPFLGRLPGIEELDINALSVQEKIKLIIQLVGPENFSEEMTNSLNEIGKTLKTWPQLGATATIAGGVIATTIKKIVLGEKVKSGRYVVSLDKILA